VPPKPSLNVSLTPHLEQFIAASVASGRYQSASEVVRAGLRLLERLENGEPQSAAVGDSYLRRRITAGDAKTLKTSSEVGGDGSSAGAKKGTGRGSPAKVPRHA
jgi:antitoxin ParD1/3/4